MTASSIIHPCLPTSWRENDRLAALHRYAIFDTPMEPLFDDMAQLAADICEAPVAIINFIGQDRQWFKAEVGVGAREAPIEVSICRHAIHHPGLFVVPDLSLDARFADNPMVAAADGLRFYAGAPLEAPGHLPLGMFCIFDRAPRAEGLSDRQGRMLLSLARQVMSELDLRLTLAQRDVEIAEAQEAAARERALAHEVDHRAKNLLAVVQSVVQLTRADTAAGVKRAVVGRIHALARAHSLLAATRWDGADLRRLVEEEFAAFDDQNRLSVTGPSILLRSAAAQAMALTFHELMINAAKYGALSDDVGRLAVSWGLRPSVDGECLELDWREHGGPPVTRPVQRGFGSSIIEASVEQQLGGLAIMDWASEGLHVTLKLPIRHISGVGTITAAEQNPRHATKSGARSFMGRRVLIVEDEVLIAAHIRDLIETADGKVLGPAATSAQALSLLDAFVPDVAVLDINLAGDRSFQVADALKARAIPFAFSTGYAGGGDLPAHFHDVPIIVKPLDPAHLVATLAGLALPDC